MSDPLNCHGEQEETDHDNNSSSKREDSPIQKKGCRTRLPVCQPDKVNINLWSYLKQCIGKELTKITMPVHWNEPLSLLQRITEYMNYAHLLRAAPSMPDPVLRLQQVATFAVSALASNNNRMGKPFNPMLGETYQLEQEDFRIVCEQVCHHPPVSAFHSEGGPNGSDFLFHGSIYPKVKFWGKSIEFQPKGALTVEFPLTGEMFTWSNVNCVVHNIVVGSLWMEHTGTMEIVSHSTGLRAVLSFKPGGWFSGNSDLHCVEGFIIDSEKRKLRFLYGRWTEFICSADPDSLVALLGCKLEKINPDATNLPKHPPLLMGAVPGSTVLWEAAPRPIDSDKYYNFSSFTMKLNEAGQGGALAPTDCRNRPDIRALEEGDLDAAALQKEYLENKQREFRKVYKNKKESEWWTPRWFTQCKNPATNEDDWRSTGQFWEGDFSKCPQIF